MLLHIVVGGADQYFGEYEVRPLGFTKP